MATKTTTRACPVCAGCFAHVLHHQRFVVPEGYPLPDAFDVVACVACGMCFADTDAPQAAYDAYYASFSQYEDRKTSSGSGTSASDAARLSEVAACIARVLPDKDARIVDIGCANGFLLGQLKALGFGRLLGVDPSRVCVDHTRALGVEAVTGSVTRLPADLGQFDLIILSHVVEHLREPQAIIGALAGHLGPNGAFYVEVPDASRYEQFLVAPFQDFNTEHINHFSSGSLDDLLARIGFDRGEHGDKVVESSRGMGFPATFGFWRRGERKVGGGRDDLDAALLRYVAASRAMLERMSRRIAEALATSPKIVVWGTGQLAMKLLDESPLAGADIAAFVDGSATKQGHVIRGISVSAPAILRSLPYPVLITSTIHHDAIAQTIREMGLANVLISLKE